MRKSTSAEDEPGKPTDEDHPDSSQDEPDSSPLRRRTLLGGFAATGTAGALSATGLYGLDAFLSDTELFGETGSGETNSVQTGELDLGLAWESYYNPRNGNRERVDSAGDCDSGEFVDGSGAAIDLSGVQPGDAGSTEFCLQVDGNPGWLWVESTCPDPGAERALEATVSYDGACDGQAEPVVLASGESIEELSGSLCAVLATLGEGVRLGLDCVDPDTTHCLSLEWSFPNPEYRGQYEEYEGTELTFGLEFLAVQCRHNPDPRPPTEDGCQPRRCAGSGPPIDLIAYCADGQQVSAGEVSHEVLQSTDDGAPTKVGWESEIQLSTVVLYSDTSEWPQIENFHVDDGVASGTAMVGEGNVRARAALDDDQSLSDPAPDGETAITYVYNETTGAFERDK